MTNLAENQLDFLKEISKPSLGWQKNPSVKKLLDALVSILKEEYIQKVKENPEIFSN